MFAVEVTDQIMIAHSFRGAVFGPAQQLHGATFVVRAAFLAERLDPNGIVVDIGRASDVLKATLAPLNYKNLDALPQFKGINTTTEFVTKFVFDALAAAARADALGRNGRELSAIKVTVLGIANGARLVRGAVVVKSMVFAIPGDLATPTGGYAYDRRIIAELVEFGWSIDILDLGDGFPHPTAAERFAAGAQLAELPGDVPIVIDGLAFGALADAAATLQGSHNIVALVHHPLALETGLEPEEAAAMQVSERAALSFARHVVATSAATARLLTADFGVAQERLTVVRPGTDRATVARRAAGATVKLLALGSVVPRKGYDVLIAALATLADLPWQLVIVGDRGRSPATAQQSDAEIARHRLSSRISFAGAVPPEELPSYYTAADLFVLPSRFEGYGMAYTEAIAHGLPVIGTTAGAIPDTVPESAGLLVPPDDVEALAGALRSMIERPHERERLAAGAMLAAARYPSWQEQAALFAHVLENLLLENLP